MTHQILQEAARTRRSVYALNKNLPLPAEEVAAIVEHAVLHTPSSFNSQSTRVVVLFGAEHEKLWQLTEAALRQIVPADKFEPTTQKLAGFAAAAGTVLFFEDQSVVHGLQEQFPAYAANFPVWAEHADAMHRRQPATLQSRYRPSRSRTMANPRQLDPARPARIRRHRRTRRRQTVRPG